MKTKIRKGLTLIELVVVIAVIAILVFITLPAFQTIGRGISHIVTRNAIDSTLSNARMTAHLWQRYAGIRFQREYISEGKLPKQYMIPIIQDTPSTGLDYGFRTMEGKNILGIPRDMGVMELESSGATITDSDFDEEREINDATTFSIVFSPAGTLVIHDASVVSSQSQDPIFNTIANITSNNTGKFAQDEYPALGFKQEPSKRRILIYESNKFQDALNEGAAWSNYLEQLTPSYINPHIGTLIKKKN
jgi:prepilin-type N-terminal cleavage/methylation domain-containing protein